MVCVFSNEKLNLGVIYSLKAYLFITTFIHQGPIIMKKLIYSLVLFGTGFFLFSPHLAFSESFSESVESVYPESINFQLLFYVLEEEASEDIIEGLDVDFAVKNQNCTSVENRFFDKAGNTDLYGHYYTNYNYFLYTIHRMTMLRHRS